MPRTNRDAFLLHFRKLGIVPGSVCPVCSNESWIVHNLVAPQVLQENEEGQIVPLPPGNLSFPMVPVVCERCGYIRHFAWLTIKQAIEDGQA